MTDQLIDDTNPHLARGGTITPLKPVDERGPMRFIADKPDQQRRVQAMVGFPAPIKLSPADADAFRKLGQRKIALQTWTQMVTEQGEQRMRAIVEDEQKAVLAIAKQHGLDIERVLYTFDPATDTFVPVQMRMR